MPSPNSQLLAVHRSPAPKTKLCVDCDNLREWGLELETDNSALNQALSGQKVAQAIDSDAQLTQWVAFLDSERVSWASSRDHRLEANKGTANGQQHQS
jgi:hypothetical protein